TYNTRNSLVVTDPTTTRALSSLTRAERTGCRAFCWVWSYVLGASEKCHYIVQQR
ncbi:hypothetical protein MYCTH_2062976, partial [Thermothelomyces thermophilus ATCC 42464]